MGLAGFRCRRLNHVRVDGALGQPVDILQFQGLVVEDIDKGIADNLALGLRVLDPRQPVHKLVLGVHPDHLHPHMEGEHIHHLVALVLAQQTVVHEYAGQLVADGPVQQGRHHRGVDPAGEAEQHLVLPHLVADAVDGVVDNIGRRPQGFATAYLQHKALE